MGLVCPGERHPQLENYVSELTLDSYSYMPAAYVTMNCMI